MGKGEAREGLREGKPGREGREHQPVPPGPALDHIPGRVAACLGLLRRGVGEEDAKKVSTIPRSGENSQLYCLVQ